MTTSYKVHLHLKHDETPESWIREYSFSTVPIFGDFVQLWEPENSDERRVSLKIDSRSFAPDGNPVFDLVELNATYNQVEVPGDEIIPTLPLPIGGYADLESRLTKAGWTLKK